jgi:hypothetical protein
LVEHEGLGWGWVLALLRFIIGFYYLVVAVFNLSDEACVVLIPEHISS